MAGPGADQPTDCPRLSKDPYIQTAIAHWAPRFVANGVLYTDFQEITAKVERWDDWCDAWSACAAVHEKLGQQALEEGYVLTAADHLKRASAYYHFAKFVFVHDRDAMRAAHMKSVQCRELASPFMQPPSLRVEIPFAGRAIAGLMRRPASVEMAPVVIMVPGLDSTKEELESYEAPFLERGIATLCIDGPGQGESEYEIPIRADYEAPIRAVVDWIEQHGKVDAKRVGICGVSLGGYYAPRAAAFEKRLKACIGLSGPYNLGDNWERLPQLSREVFRVRSHLTTLDEARRHSETLTLGGGIAGRIECPLFLVAGKQDRLIDWRDAERLAAEVSGPVTVIAVEDGNHIANNRPYRYRHQMADWMADQLGVGERARATP